MAPEEAGVAIDLEAREAEPRRRRFTVDEYYRMADARILREDDRVELLDGEIVTVPAMSSQHAGTVTRLTHLLTSRCAGRALVSPQNVVRLDEHSEPQPDLALLRPRDDFYSAAHPRPADVFLLIEVGLSSAWFDARVKQPLYARAGICELWLIDLGAEQVTVCRQPGPEGYGASARRRRGDRVTIAALDEEFAVEELIG